MVITLRATRLNSNETWYPRAVRTKLLRWRHAASISDVDGDLQAFSTGFYAVLREWQQILRARRTAEPLFKS